jgi:hypothetical protein
VPEQEVEVNLAESMHAEGGILTSLLFYLLQNAGTHL